jgi:hypothetical protein
MPPSGISAGTGWHGVAQAAAVRTQYTRRFTRRGSPGCPPDASGTAGRVADSSISVLVDRAAFSSRCRSSLVEQLRTEGAVVDVSTRGAAHGGSFLHVIESVQVALQPGETGLQSAAVVLEELAHQRLPAGSRRLGQAATDLLQRQVDGAQRDDEEQVRHLRRGVQPHPGALSHRDRPEQPKPVVVPQRPRRRTGPAGQCSDRQVGHGANGMSLTRVNVKPSGRPGTP